jgi:hypothetical protein
MMNDIIAYLGNYSGFVFVGFGAIFFLFVKSFSSKLDRRKPVSFYHENDENHSNTRAELEYAFSATAESNELQRFVKDLPQSAEEITNFISQNNGRLTSIEASYLAKKIQSYGIAEEKSGLLKKESISIEDIAAYKIYNAALNEGKYKIKNGIKARKLLEINGIIRANFVTSEILRKTISTSGKALLVADSKVEKYIEQQVSSFTDTGALILMLELSGMITVLL